MVDIQPVPEDMDEMCKPYGLDFVWNIEQHIGDLKKEFDENPKKVYLKNLSEDYTKIASKDLNCDLETLKKIYDEVQNGGKNIPFELKVIIKYSLVSKLLEADIIDKAYYKLILEVAKKIKLVEKFRMNAFCDVVVAKYLNLKDMDPPYIELIEGFQFIKQLSEVIKPEFSIESELYDLTSPIKIILMRKMKNRDIDNLREVIAMILQAEEHSADLKIFKKTFELDLKNWVKWGKIDAFDFSDLAGQVKLKNFIEIPEDAPDILMEDQFEEKVKFEKAEKLKPIYMTHQEAVEVSVWQARKENNEIIALKECVAPNNDLLRGYCEEDRLLKFLSGKSRNFLNYYGSDLQTAKIGDINKIILTIHMEYVEMTLKNDKINRNQKKQPYNDFEIINIYKQLVLSFNLLRDLNILHCDIKPSNIMITKEQIIKIIDFNAAKQGIHEATQQISAVGTKDFMSPELRKGLASNQMAAMKEDKSDVFSLGMTILYLVTEEPLIDLNLPENEKKLKEIINSIKYEWLKPVLSKMLEFEYVKRPGLKNLISHFGTDISITMDT